MLRFKKSKYNIVIDQETIYFLDIILYRLRLFLSNEKTVLFVNEINRLNATRLK